MYEDRTQNYDQKEIHEEYMLYIIRDTPFLMPHHL